MSEDNELKPIKLFTYIYFMGFGLFCLAGPLTADRTKHDNTNFFIFCYVLSFIHLFIGVGILSLKKWGFYCLKYYMYFLKPGYPVGTYIANKMLTYLKDHNIERYFDK